MQLPELTEEQAAALLEKKKVFAKENGQGDDACQNLKCRCVECTCGAACTCNISPEKNCDECKIFKQTVVATKNKERLQAAIDFYSEKIAPKFEGLPSIRANELQRVLTEGSTQVLLVDCRSDAERAVSTIPRSVSSVDFEADPEGLGAGKLVVPYCTIGGRSAAFVRKMLDLPSKPWADMRNFELSIIDWCHAGGELWSAPDTATVVVHAGGEGMVPLFPIAGYEVVLSSGE